MVYDRQLKEQAFLHAVGAIIARDGVGALGVNAIAREAGANKALLYRYFGDLDGLYRAFGASEEIWPPTDEVLGDALSATDWRSAVGQLMANYARALRARPLTLQLLALEMVERNALTIAFEEVREQRSGELAAAVGRAGIAPVDEDVGAALALIAGAINYLAVRAQSIKVFAGASVDEDAFWTDALPRLVERMLRGFQ